jgi:hypothetical protein
MLVYGFRFYDPAIARFTTVDPLAEKYSFQNPYAYAANNPIKFIDYMGLGATNEYVRDTDTGEYRKVGNKGGDNVDYIYEGKITKDENGKQNAEVVKVHKSHFKSEVWSYDRGPGYLHTTGGYNPAAPTTISPIDAVFLGVPSLIKALSANSKTTASNPQNQSNLVKIEEMVDDVIVFSAKVGEETIQGISNFRVVGDKLHLNGLHIQGSAAGKIGRANLWRLSKDLGNQFGVRNVIIQGGRRTTGKYKGEVPSPLNIKVE